MIVRALRAEQLRVETLHEAARALLDCTPANEDRSLEPLPFEGTPMPWVMNVVQFHPPGRTARARRPA